MGQRIIQRIRECETCKRTPDDGEYMWEMCGNMICENCIDLDESDLEDEDNE